MRHGGVVAAGIAIWAVALATVTVAPELLPVVSMGSLIPVLLAVPVRAGPSIARLLGGSVGVTFRLIGLAAIRDTGYDRAAPNWLLDIITITTLPSAVAVVLLIGLRNHEMLTARNDELRRSRATAVSVADGERTRIERDLHDGAQQRLHGALVLTAICRRVLPANPAKAARLLDDVREQLRLASDELIDLVHRQRPPNLSRGGLAAALEELAGQRHARVDVRFGYVGRYPRDIEDAVWFCCLEGVANAEKHAGTGCCIVIELAEANGALQFEIADDGPGFAGRRPGSKVAGGIANMHERIGALGGALQVRTSPSGTRVIGTVPVSTGTPARTDAT